MSPWFLSALSEWREACETATPCLHWYQRPFRRALLMSWDRWFWEAKGDAR